jgi:hypothetical protein
MAVSIQIVVDCRDPARLARFWAEALGYQVQPPPTGFDSWESFLLANDVPESEWNSASAVVDPEGHGPRIFFQRVPEPKTVKNRVHLDLNVGGDPSTPSDRRRSRLEGERVRLVEAGAEVVGPVEQRGEYWIVLRDPEGNEFCIQ